MSRYEKCNCQGNDIVCKKCGATYQKSGNSFLKPVPKGSGGCKKYAKCPFCHEECCLEFDRPTLRP
nr:hypothetical protein [uncultured Kingella sp.]